MSELIKRKDGSYSRRGLWDNIRANKGSGKKPTKEMLAQERKIKKMEDGGSIPERYRNMGFSRVGQKKASTNEGKKWMVLAKKGDQYKVVHGGYKGMQDFKQHGSEQRKENFWNRMGGRNSSKATDPFSPLYWHKRLGTWEEGGQLPQYEDGGWIDKIIEMFNPLSWFNSEDTQKLKTSSSVKTTPKTSTKPLKDVTIAKILGGYNWGPAKMRTFLEEQKKMGVDIHNSLKWVNNLPKETKDYINRALLNKDPVFQKQLERDTINSPYNKYFGYGPNALSYSGVLPKEVALRASVVESHHRKDIATGKKTSKDKYVGLMQVGPEVEADYEKKYPGENLDRTKPADNVKLANYQFDWLSKRPYLNKSEKLNTTKKENGGTMNKLGDTSNNRRNLLKQGVGANLYPLPFAKGGKMYKQGGIFIKPENRGKFTAWAKSKGMGVQEAASQVMANKEEYSPTIVKRANFAKNAAGWNKAQGGRMAMNYNLGNMNIEPKSYAQGGGIDNPGFKSLPDFVQAKIKANMEAGGVMRYRMGGKTKFSKMC